jgi:glutamine synthetase
MFESLHVMSRKELEARNEIKWETYTKKVQIEARIFGDLSINHIIPQVVAYQTKLAENVAAMKSILPEAEFKTLCASNLALISEIGDRVRHIEEGCAALTEARKVANKIESQREKAIAYHDTVEPLMEKIRYHIDKLEAKVDDEVWTLPKYREMLFMR